jgi:hypothetical protein
MIGGEGYRGERCVRGFTACLLGRFYICEGVLQVGSVCPLHVVVWFLRPGLG